MALSVTVHGITIKTGTQTSGRLATADITAKDGLDNVVYTLPASPDMDYAILAISICNRDTDSATPISLAVGDSAVPKAYDFIEWNTTIVPRGVLERTQLTIEPGQSIIVRWGTSPDELIPDSELRDYAGSWTGAVTGTGAIDSSVAGRVTFTLAEGDTGTLTTPTLGTTATNTVLEDYDSEDYATYTRTFVYNDVNGEYQYSSPTAQFIAFARAVFVPGAEVEVFHEGGTPFGAAGWYTRTIGNFGTGDDPFWNGSIRLNFVENDSTGDLIAVAFRGNVRQTTVTPVSLVEGATYRAGVSFYSTDATGVAPAITMTADNGAEDVSVVTLGLEDTNRIDDYRTYYTDFVVDDATDYTTSIQQFDLNLADVEVTVDRITLKKILGQELITNGDFATDDFTGWNSASAAVVGGSAVLTDGSNINQGAISAADTVNGRTVQVSLDVTGTTHTSLTLIVQSDSQSTTYINQDITGESGTVTATLEYDDTDPDFFVRIAASGTGTTTIDNVSIRSL